jgi:hypothetical protein
MNDKRRKKTTMPTFHRTPRHHTPRLYELLITSRSKPFWTAENTCYSQLSTSLCGANNIKTISNMYFGFLYRSVAYFESKALFQISEMRDFWMKFFRRSYPIGLCWKKLENDFIVTTYLGFFRSFVKIFFKVFIRVLKSGKFSTRCIILKFPPEHSLYWKMTYNKKSCPPENHNFSE